MDWYLAVLKNYIGFTGRARRKEYWMFFLFNYIITLAITLLQLISVVFIFVVGIYYLAMFLPSKKS
ncbi:DUF805 domain-containing protein [Paenibacillus sp. N1-5-1-14]|uniref:DUF805 domain-containing protein n=1 Tax=Paenibacillus radicibacter TaxID=2972488 RepID=UPI0021590210|nr:DUF805 domain-containing protein [Paenibacillus radicibacter]MCR8642398.1 DUF805 domain-containing protein [Paenibacillus radicibacter]